jgi:outer membrane translocation and assembly module TamA
VYGLGRFKLAGLHSFFEIDSREIQDHPSSGIYFRLSGSYYPELLDNNENFVSGAFDLRSYFTADILTETTIAFRTGGEKIWGSFPFFKSVFLGGSGDLRGFSRERFSGEASLFGQAEMRFLLTEFSLIFLAKSGIHLFTETGRVFTGNSDSEKWHPSYGGGFWISYLQKKLTFAFTVAGSPEKTAFYIHTGFMF